MKDRIKEVRKSTGMTQVEFGEKLGVKGNTVTNYETGQRTPTDAVIRSICREFHVNEEWLRYGTGEMFPPKTKDELISDMIGEIQRSGEDNFKHRLVSALSKLSKSDWEALERLIDSIAKK
jgi:transcriptional regulator with XRE-family HTH domain